jgi:hypothetical protein
MDVGKKKKKHSFPNLCASANTGRLLTTLLDRIGTVPFLIPSHNRELLTGVQLYQFPTYNRPWLLSPFAVAFSTSFSFQFSKRDASAPIV